MSLLPPPSINWKERGYAKPGLKPDLAVLELCERFKVSEKRVRLHGVDRLDRCADDEARRLLLRCSR